jgi:hypothetical protein
MKLFTALLTVAILAGCSTERQVSFGEIPIYRINHKMLQQKAAAGCPDNHLGYVMGLVERDRSATPQFKIYYSSELNEMQAIANVIHEGIGHVHVYRTGDARIWDTIDMLAAKDVYGMIIFPVASDRHPTKQVFAWDKSEHAQEVRAIYAATVEARKSGGEY